MWYLTCKQIRADDMAGCQLQKRMELNNKGGGELLYTLASGFDRWRKKLNEALEFNKKKCTLTALNEISFHVISLELFFIISIRPTVSSSVLT